MGFATPISESKIHVTELHSLRVPWETGLVLVSEIETRVIFTCNNPGTAAVDIFLHQMDSASPSLASKTRALLCG